MARPRKTELPRTGNVKHIPGNLTRLMTERGLSDSRLGALIGISRQAVYCWRQGTNSPSDENLGALCVALQCERRDFLRPVPPPSEPMMLIGEWARRENIPLARARDLFALRLLTGEVRTDYTIRVPVALRAPRDSKSLVTMTKKRPRWVPLFQENFPRMMKESGLSESRMGRLIGVNPAAVRHWVHGRNYPTRERLPLIAKALRTTVFDLAGHV